MTIRALNRDELEIVQKIAHATWPDTFNEILSLEQIDYMLDWMYDLSMLEAQFDKGHHFFVIEEQSHPMGFVGIELNHPISNTAKIHKIYILPAAQGRGIGKKLMAFSKDFAIHHKMNCVTLNVNRFNKATSFYEHLGFKIDLQEDIDIGNGYLMEDYRMSISLK